ncbi:hypothetical protein LguiB_028305 [Lonicera macranthoides]
MAGPGKCRSTQSTVNSSLQTPLSPQEFSGLETSAFSSAIVPPSHENNVSSNGDNPMPERHRLSDRNRKNRAKQNTPHTAATKSFARIRHEKKKEMGTLPGQIKLYEMTRFSRKKQAWVNEEAEQNHEKMKQLLFESQVEGTESKTEEEICAQVLGRKSKPTSSLYKEQYRAELDEVIKKAERAEQENNEIKQKKNNEMELKMQEMEALQKRMDEMLKTLMEQMSNGGYMVLRP